MELYASFLERVKDMDEKEIEKSIETSNNEPERRFVNGRWICKSGDGVFLEYIDNEWRTVEETEDLNVHWEAATSSTSNYGVSTTAMREMPRCVVNGVEMVWNLVSQQWIPDVEVDEDFLASYHANYGVAYDYSQIDTAKPPTAKEKPLSKEEQKAKKREMEQRENSAGWVEIDDTKNTNVYVSGLPSTITEEKFIEFMSKCGVIMKDPRNNRLKVKIYRTEDGDPKGDATCCYVKMESVELALKILDGWDLDGHCVSVEKAHFQLKGDFDPSKKKRRLTAMQKKRFFENQQKIFEWKPEKPRNYRPISDCTVVFKNMFTLEEIDKDTSRIFDLKSEMELACARFGNVKKVIVYDTNPEGVVTVTFENVESSDLAIQMLNRTHTSLGQVISASLWDGRTKFRREETEEERHRRDEAWQQFIENEEGHNEEEDGISDTETGLEDKKQSQ